MTLAKKRVLMVLNTDPDSYWRMDWGYLQATPAYPRLVEAPDEATPVTDRSAADLIRDYIAMVSTDHIDTTKIFFRIEEVLIVE